MTAAAPKWSLAGYIERIAMTVAQLLLSMHAVSIPDELRDELTKAHLLAEIDAASRAAAEQLVSDANCTMGTVFPRGRARFRWRGRQVRIWRLNLRHPLWLGEDGVIYRGYEVDTWDGWDFPHYLLAAEIELRGIRGLQRVLRAVRELTPQV